MGRKEDEKEINAYKSFRDLYIENVYNSFISYAPTFFNLSYFLLTLNLYYN